MHRKNNYFNTLNDKNSFFFFFLILEECNMEKLYYLIRLLLKNEKYLS